jgi:enediyne polyketide synthase
MAGLAFHEVGELLKVSIEETGGPQGQEVFVNKFIPNFKMFANLDRTLFFPHYFSWMGETRELAAAPILCKISDAVSTGKWGLVTNNATLEILGEKMGEDNVVQVRLWSGHAHGPANSTVELHFEWVSWDSQGPTERLAFARMKTTWVEVLGHGQVRPVPLPDFYAEFIDEMSPRYEAPDRLSPLPEPLRNVAVGQPLFKAKNGPRARVFLADKAFETTLYDSNLVGNLYFSNYAMWMAKLREAYFFSLAPDLFRGFGEQGVLKCLRCNIDHLREGMPFDTIYVSMSLKNLFENGADLYFEFFKQDANSQKTKLAFGDHRAVWMTQKADGQWSPDPLPEPIGNALLQAATRAEQTMHPMPLAGV